MGANARYDITKIDKPTGFDEDLFLFKLRKASPEAKIYIDEDGEPTGNDGVWNNFVKDMCSVTAMFPDITVYVTETMQYETTEDIRYVFHNGRWQSIEPVTIWPEFDGNWQDVFEYKG